MVRLVKKSSVTMPRLGRIYTTQHKMHTSHASCLEDIVSQLLGDLAEAFEAFTQQ